MISIHTFVTILTIMATLWLVSDEDYYFPRFLGPIIDLFFKRDPDDDLVSGSGYTLFVDQNWKTISAFYAFLVSLFWRTLLLVSLPPIVFLVHFWRKTLDKVNEWEATCRYIQENDGAIPPWRLKARPTPAPTHDTRYMTLGGDGSVIWVCGVGGGFEDVINEDIEGAIARRWRSMGRKQFS